MARDKDPLSIVRAEIAELPEDLQESGLASIALTLAKRLREAGLRDTPPIARELRNTLSELRTLASESPEEDDPVENEQSANANRFANS